jgi:TatD DNase family protein
MLIDTHAHLLKEEFGEDLEKIITEIQNSDVKIVNNIGYSIKSSRETVRLADRYDFLFAVVGVHPYDINELKNSDTIETLKNLSLHKKVVAIGEIGLDYFRSITDYAVQRKYFEAQLMLAKESNLPFVIHSRDAFEDTFAIIKNVGYYNGVFHSFDYGPKEAEKVLENNMFISFSGMLTFKSKEKLREAAKIVPFERVLFETDSPYLAPVPKRGKRNTPLYVRYVYDMFSKIRSIDMDKLEKIVENNYKHLFVRSVNFLDRRQHVQNS